MNQILFKIYQHQHRLLSNMSFIDISRKRIIDIFQSQQWGYSPYDNFLLLRGNIASGKTYLTHIWKNICLQKNETVIDSISIKSLLTSNYHCAILDDIDKMPAKDLLHIFNILFEKKIKTLMTIRLYPIKTKLSDLTSRINSIKNMPLIFPNEKIVANMLTAEFRKRNISISNQVIKYMIFRLPQNLSIIMKIIEQIDEYILKYKKKITILIVKNILNKDMIIT